MADSIAKSSLISSCSTRPWSLYCNRPTLSPVLVPFCRRSGAEIEALGGVFLRSNVFWGRKLVVENHKGSSFTGDKGSLGVKMELAFPKAVKWWEKGIQRNMKEIESANDLVDSLSNSGDRLVIVDFFSPGCAGCRSLHPKICQIAEQNPDVLFLTVNYGEHKSMCYSLHVHVLPFFRFYRGSQGKLCSFSCTNATIKKFKDALAKHTPERCSIGPAMGLEEKELLALAANKDLNFTYTPKTEPVFVPSLDKDVEKVPALAEFSLPAAHQSSLDSDDDKVLVAAG